MELYLVTLTKIGDIMELYNSCIWVCLKIVYPIVPNGFADHYPC